jgi:drug/metabolite transporter (DMT)-like permease
VSHSSPSPRHFRACVWLFLATAFWGLSFPFIKSIWTLQQQLVPEASTVFLAAAGATIRFGVAALIMALFCARSLRNITRLEWEEGALLGLFGGLGIVVQMDGLAHTDASVSAFLTQFYCLLIPIWVALRRHAWPKPIVVVSSIMVLAGVAVLARIDWRTFELGRGEAETLLAAFFFAGQMLLLERPRYAPNRVATFTVIMFSATALLLAPLALILAPSGRALVNAYRSPDVALLMAGVVVFCTLGAYTLMNTWQPHVTATEAGLIYCVEPLFASVFALVLPGWISSVAGINYPNETLTVSLLVGGGLITSANVVMQVNAMRQKRRGAHAPSIPP